MSEAEKLQAIRRLVGQMALNQDEYAVGIAWDIAQICDGLDLADQILFQSRRGASGLRTIDELLGSLAAA